MLPEERLPGGLFVGMLLDIGSTYQVLEFARVRRAGEEGCRYRLVIQRFRGATVEVVWKLEPAPERQAKSVIEPVPSDPDEVRQRVIAARRQSEREQHARILRIGAEDESGGDYGPAIRRRDIRWQGEVLRVADVRVEDGVDPAAPKQRVRRAVRSDPLDALRRAGSITGREVDAAEEMRRYLEQLEPAMGGGLGVAVQSAAFDRMPITPMHLVAARKVRMATATLGERYWPPVCWVLLHGTVEGYARERRIRLARAGELVRSGFAMLADHLFGKAVAA